MRFTPGALLAIGGIALGIAALVWTSIAITLLAIGVVVLGVARLVP